MYVFFKYFYYISVSFNDVHYIELYCIILCYIMLHYSFSHFLCTCCVFERIGVAGYAGTGVDVATFSAPVIRAEQIWFITASPAVLISLLRAERLVPPELLVVTCDLDDASTRTA